MANWAVCCSVLITVFCTCQRYLVLAQGPAARTHRTAAAHRCERNCFTDHRNATLAILGNGIGEKSVAFLMPIETIFEQSTTFENATEKVRQFCRSVLECNRCLKECGTKMNMLQMAMKPKEIMCRAYITRTPVFQCLYEKRAEVRTDCESDRNRLQLVIQQDESEMMRDKELLKSTCIAFQRFETCHFSSLVRHCRINETEFWLPLQQSSTDAMTAMIRSMSEAADIPDTCNQLPEWPRLLKPTTQPSTNAQLQTASATMVELSRSSWLVSLLVLTIALLHIQAT